MHKLRCKKLLRTLASCEYVRCFALLLLPCISTACFGQTINIRIVDVRNQKPITDARVSVSGISVNAGPEQVEKRKLRTKPTTPDLRLVTDSNGEAQFDLPNPAPAYFYVRAELRPIQWDCFCLLRVSTEQVTQKGLAVSSAGATRLHDYHRLLTKPRNQPRPTEILFRIAPNPLWLKIFWPLFSG